MKTTNTLLILSFIALLLDVSNSLDCRWKCKDRDSWHKSQCWDCNQVPDSTTRVVIDGGASVNVTSDASALSISLSAKSQITLGFNNSDDPLSIIILESIQIDQQSSLIFYSDLVSFRGNSTFSTFLLNGTANGFGYFDHFNLTLGEFAVARIERYTEFGNDTNILNHGLFVFERENYYCPFAVNFTNDGILRFSGSSAYQGSGRGSITNYKLIEVNSIEVQIMQVRFVQTQCGKFVNYNSGTSFFLVNSNVDLGGSYDLGNAQFSVYNSTAVRRSSSYFDSGLFFTFGSIVHYEVNSNPTSKFYQEADQHSVLHFLGDYQFNAQGIYLTDTAIHSNTNKVEMHANLFEVFDLRVQRTKLKLVNLRLDAIELNNRTLIERHSVLTVTPNVLWNQYSSFSGNGIMDLSQMESLEMNDTNPVDFGTVNVVLPLVRMRVQKYRGNFITTTGSVQYKKGVEVYLDSAPESPEDSFGICKFGQLLSVPTLNVFGAYSCLNYSLVTGVDLLEYFYGLPNFPRNSSIEAIRVKSFEPHLFNLTWTVPSFSCNVSVRSTTVEETENGQVWEIPRGGNMIQFSELKEKCQSYDFEFSQSFQWDLFPEVTTGKHSPALSSWAYDSGMIEEFGPKYNLSSKVVNETAIQFAVSVDRSQIFPCDSVATSIQFKSTTEKLSGTSNVFPITNGETYQVQLLACKIWRSTYRIGTTFNGVEFFTAWSNASTSTFLVKNPESVGTIVPKQDGDKVLYSWKESTCGCDPVVAQYSIKFSAQGSDFFFLQTETSIKLDDYPGSQVKIAVNRVCYYSSGQTTSEISSLEFVTKKENEESKTTLIVVGSFFALLVVVALFGCIGFVIHHFTRRGTSEEKMGLMDHH